ncbi:MAG: hypothetical protein EPN21_19010 [Methylococcaceae bacterium]|nr:MAG: hypothetical protein EPN21_19010 [Methylococcaceae bacterium]
MKNNIPQALHPIFRQAALRRPALLCSLPLLCACSLPLHAEEERPWGQITDNLRISGDLRGRVETWDYFEPALNPATGVINNNNDYTFGALRARLAVAFNSSILDAFVQSEYSGLYDLPDNAVAGPPVGPLGLGGAYYRENSATSRSDVHLKQAYLNFKGQSFGLPGAAFKVGRFEIAEGLEYKTGDAKFDMLKTTRVSQRLVGPFDFTHATRNFDGFSTVYDQTGYNITLTGARPTQAGFNIQGMDEISHIDVFYGALTSKKGAILPGTEGRLFYLYYGDDRNVVPVDNRPAAARPALNSDDMQIHTVGTHLLTVQPMGAGDVDAVLWGAYQFGDWGNLNHQAYASDAEIGYQWKDVFMKPWLRAVYFRGSGDSNPTDGTHGTFFQVLPTVRAYAKFPFYNLMNIQDSFLQASITPTQNTRLAVDAHYLTLENAHDLYYGGAGATSRTGTFGYFGRATGRQNSVGELVDITFTHTVNTHFNWSLYYGHAFGSDATKSVYQQQGDANFGYAEFTVSF